MKKQLNIPKFNSEEREREFWSKIDLAEHFAPEDFSRATFPNLKPSSRSVSLRVPEYILARLKEKAHELNIPYQSLMKQYIAQGLLHK